MNRFLVLSFAILFSTLFVVSCFGYSASAAEIPPVNLASHLFLQINGGERTNHNNDYITKIEQSLNPNYVNNPDRNLEAFKRDLNRALNEGTWFLTQFEQESNGKMFGYFSLYFNYSKDCDTTLGYRNSAYYLDVKATTDCRWRQVKFDANPVANYYGNSASYVYSNQQISFENTFGKLSLFLFSGEYKLSKNLEGYDIQLPSSVGEIQQRPLFFYRVDKLNFWGVYVNNIEVLKPYDQNIELAWKVYSADDSFHKTGDPLFEYRGRLLEPFNYDFEAYGRYVVTVSFDFPAPLDIKNVKPTYFEFQLNVDGSYFVGDSIAGCKDGVCASPVVQCSSYKDFTGRLQCEMRNRFNFGLINPSITAFKDLLLSFTVRSPIRCSLGLPDVSIYGRGFPTSQIGVRACDNLSRFHSAMPIIAIFSNFVLAFLIFRMIARIINDLTNPNKHDVVEGV